MTGVWNESGNYEKRLVRPTNDCVRFGCVGSDPFPGQRGRMGARESDSQRLRPGASRVAHLRGSVGEIAGNLRKRFGALKEVHILRRFCRAKQESFPPLASGCAAAALKVDKSMAYADAFALDLAMEASDHVLITADYDFKSVRFLRNKNRAAIGRNDCRVAGRNTKSAQAERLLRIESHHGLTKKALLG